MTRKDEILAAFDDAWDDPICESLTVALDGVTEESAAYQHPIYSDTKDEEDYPPAGTILWHLAHLADCYRHYIGTIVQRPKERKEMPVPEAHSLAEAIANLKRDRAVLWGAIASVPEEQLDDEVFDYDTVAHFVRMIVRHDAWHASQIAVVKRMYRMR